MVSLRYPDFTLFAIFPFCSPDDRNEENVFFGGDYILEPASPDRLEDSEETRDS